MQVDQDLLAQGEGATSQNQGARTKTASRTVENNNESTMKTLTNRDQDVVRLIGQHLRGIGFNQTADQLCTESGCEMEDTVAADLRTHVMDGNWDKAYVSLNDLKDKVSSTSNFEKMQYLVLEQKYLELLEEGLTVEAVLCLRQEVSPVHSDTERLHQLARCLMYESPEKLREESGWEGKGNVTRRKLLDNLQQYLPTSVMIPSSRLRGLLNQAFERQRQKCLFHNTALDKDMDSLRFLEDHICDSSQIPCEPSHVLSDHADEVWFCKFSPDGQRLVTGSKDGALIFYDVDLEQHSVRMKSKFSEHGKGVAYLAWSPDSRYLAVCSTEESPDVWLYSAERAEFIRKVTRSPDDSLTCVAWTSDSSQFATGGTRGQFILYNCAGQVLKVWEGIRVQDVRFPPNLPRTPVVAFIADTHRRLRGCRFDDQHESTILQEDHPIMSFSLNQAGDLALLNIATQGVHLWDLTDGVLLRKFQGMRHGNYVTYSSFGGLNEDFFACGNEDPAVYIFHLGHSRPVLRLEGHASIVNCVHWNPRLPSMLASASDDGTVRIWGPRTSRPSAEAERGSSSPV